MLQVRSGSFVISDGIVGYSHRGGALLPLDELSRALEFPIVVDPSRRQAEGYFISEDRRFSLDLARDQVTIEGHSRSIPSGAVEVRDNDIYVDAAVLSQWFPAEFEVRLSESAVVVTPRERLPFQERAERERRQQGLRGPATPETYERIEEPYQPYDIGIADASLRAEYSQQNGFRASYDLRWAADLAYMTSLLFIGGDETDHVSNVRWTLERRDPDGDLLGFLHATEVVLGDVFSMQIPLIGDSRTGRGALLSNFPTERATAFDRTTVRGELPIGYQVELYRNETLISFANSRPDGLYEFVDVPLDVGLNVLRLVFYGPQGQRREEVRQVYVGEDQVPPGEMRYRLSAVQQNENLILGPSSDLNNPGDGRLRFSAEGEYGVAEWLSLAVVGAGVPTEDGERYYAGIGIRTALLGTATSLDLAMDDRGAYAAQIRALARVWGVGLSFDHSEFFNGYVSDLTGTFLSGDQGDPYVRRSRIRADTTFPALWFFPAVPFSFTVDADQRRSGLWEVSATTRSSLYIPPVLLSHAAQARYQFGGGVTPSTDFAGTFSANTRFDRLSLRASLDYEMPVDGSDAFSVDTFRRTRVVPTSFSVTADYYWDEDTTFRLGADRQLHEGTQTRVFAGASQRFDQVALGVDASYATDPGDLFIGVSVNFSLGHEPLGGGWRMRSDRLADRGAVTARVFLDERGDGQYYEGARPVPNVGFRGVGGRSEVTDENGIAWLSGLSPYRRTPLVIDQGTIEEPSWVAERGGAEIVPRPGHTAMVDFPVSATGEIDGTAYFISPEGQRREVSNVDIELVRPSGEVVQTVRSEYDGFYLFQFVRPGEYRIRIAPTQAQRLHLLAQDSAAVRITGQGEVISGISLEVRRAPAPGDS